MGSTRPRQMIVFNPCLFKGGCKCVSKGANIVPLKCFWSNLWNFKVFVYKDRQTSKVNWIFLLWPLKVFQSNRKWPPLKKRRLKTILHLGLHHTLTAREKYCFSYWYHQFLDHLIILVFRFGLLCILKPLKVVTPYLILFFLDLHIIFPLTTFRWKHRPGQR